MRPETRARLPDTATLARGFSPRLEVGAAVVAPCPEAGVAAVTAPHREVSASAAVSAPHPAVGAAAVTAPAPCPEVGAATMTTRRPAVNSAAVAA
ncbi:hypothetical protein [Streptomyces aurantiacus]|uniref:hypothetical protein n=1 Tax=Streptomyces aurantiacus TaxID=47760 RepID=UPI0006E3C86A|nr:hypothetical protein [Streptomyces aurantiacus]